jgi:succinoglycan biosynthesis protein ExoM
MATISVCIATYRRAERLNLLFSDLNAQSRLPDEVVVVDNDANGSAKDTVESFRAIAPYPVRYEVQPSRNIALTRNRTVALASGDWLAFIDDDERAPRDWLRQLFEAAHRFEADGVLGPVEPIVPDTAPRWIQRGRFYDFARLPSGAIVPLNRMRFGNIILTGDRLRAEDGPFDINYGLTTGEDADLLIRMVTRGAKIVWSDETIVWEPIEQARLNARWLLQRALSGGQEFARKTVAGRYGPISFAGRAKLIARSVTQLMAASALALLSWPLGKHRAVAWLVKASANLGKISIFLGWRYQEYA